MIEPDPVAAPPELPPMIEPDPVAAPPELPPVVEPDPAVAPPDPPATDPPVIEDDPFSSNDSGKLRTWTDASGKYQVEAVLVSASDGVIRLKKSNGRYCRIVMDKLSLLDQAHVQGHLESIAAAW